MSVAELQNLGAALAAVGKRAAWDRRYAKRRHQLVAAIVGAYRDGTEIAGWLSEALGEAAVRVGGVEVLLHRRTGSWEADLVDRLAFTRECHGLCARDGRRCFICGGRNWFGEDE